MLSWLWTAMVALALGFGLAGGQAGAVGAAALKGAEKAVELGLGLAGPLCLWCGVGALMEKSGWQARLGRMLSPVLGRLFPETRKDPAAFSLLAGNVTANVLGLGNAATPLGIRACRAMGDGSADATREQRRLLVLNTASIQLVPATVGALRGSLGAENPFDILPAALLTSLCALAVGMGLLLLLDRLLD